MLEEILKRLRTGAWALLVGPPVLFLLVFTVVSIRAREAEHVAQFEALATPYSTRVENLMRGEGARLQTLSRLPVAAAVAQSAQRRDSTRADDEARLEILWERAAREDMAVRSVVDNDVAVLFRRLLELDAHLQNLILTDSRGQVLAAPEKTARYSQRGDAWWAGARAAEPGTVYSPGVNAAGIMDIGTPVIRPGRQSIVDGVLHARVDLSKLAEKNELAPAAGQVVAVLGGPAPWLVGPATSQHARASTFAERMAALSDTRGHVDGFRFVTIPLSGGMVWENPARLVVGIEESSLPLSVILLPGILFLLGAGVFATLAVLAVPLAQKHLFEPIRESSDAGAWAIKTALNRGPRIIRSSPIQKELATWYAKLQQELQRQDTSIAADIARDLEMATEFQQAFLNRPYPEIPEVHMAGRLRLEFQHRYQPALAMGGDFFDITAVANDCAGVFVGDVMGHGTRSALIVAILRTLIAEQSRRGRNAPHFLRELNNEFSALLKALPQPFFASAAYFVADTTSRIATYSVAGHPPPFHLHRAVGRVARLEMPKPHGVALGLMSGEEYGGGTVRLTDGDSFLFFTDGVYEVANATGEEFGMARMEKFIRTNVYKSSHEILDSLLEAVTHFADGQPLADDICLVAVDVRSDAR
ncbi:MAG TPA: PP2C family protein-serine/threonine phosphatase [Kiritimatiellia bacterium]|nr:PP2C family protein-serine/threonine phosphatase [Kiritimatiellia bacterium]